MSRSDEPALSTITEAMWPFFGLLQQVRPTRRRRLAPVLFRMVASELDVDVEVVEPNQGVEGLRDKAEDLVDDLQDLLGGNDHYEALEVVSDLIEALDRVSYRALVSGKL